MKKPGLATRVVHAGAGRTGANYTPTCVPIDNAVTYTYDDMHTLDAVLGGTREGYVYSRFGSPTVEALERAIAELEGSEAALACSSGMAAIHLALSAAGLAPGSTILTAQDLYGGTLSLLIKVFAPQGVRVETIEATDLPAVSTALVRSKPCVLLVETISNPLLKVADVPALAELAHHAGTLLVVDNTFATPYLYRPVQSGADYVIESATKYLGGHGDVLGGLIASSAERCQAARELQKLVGDNLGPNEAWLILRGIKTLVVRMRQQCQNAAQVALFLQSHPRVERVYHPALPEHPQHALCQRLFPPEQSGAVVSFEIRDAGREQVFRFMDALQLVLPATSLGDVYSLVLYPAHASHRALSENERQRLGIRPNLVRLSVGIEDVEDIIADLAQALQASA